MALPATGSISMSQVNVELGKAATARATFNDTDVRALAGAPTGAISMAMLRGKSREIRFINTVNRTQASIHALMGSPTAVTDYIFENESNATISAATQGGWALQTGAFPAGSTLTIINRGHIRGGGGNGGVWTGSRHGGAGGTALVLDFPAAIDNTSGTIWGGGGGGGASYDTFEGRNRSSGGGGGAGIPAGAGGSGDRPGKAGSATAGGAAGWAGRSGNGGGPGATGGSSSSGAHRGGRGGYSVQRNGHAVSWTAVGNRRGSVV